MKLQHIIITLVFCVRISATVLCRDNPCLLGYEPFVSPYYSCYDISTYPEEVICTCPDGRWRKNNPCRICDTVNCGPEGQCIETRVNPQTYYLCLCRTPNGHYSTQTGPCTMVPSTTPTTSTTITTKQTTTIARICLNNGVFNDQTNICVCQPGFSGVLCEQTIAQNLCQNVVCVNGGVCNIVPVANNGIESQCWCTNGFSGSNCELIGTAGRCSSNFCHNGGVCEDRTLGSSTFSYCRCSAGFTGRLCQEKYFSCSVSGFFIDQVHCRFGRYFQCVNNVLISRSCEKNLRFNPTTMRCESNVVCP